MKGRYYIIVFLLAIGQSFVANSQNKKETKVYDLKINMDSSNQSINVEFLAKNKISNLLIHINNERGETIFLDNQYDFLEKYNKHFNIKDQIAKSFSIEVIADKETYFKTIAIN
jgi:hypothetical protein